MIKRARNLREGDMIAGKGIVLSVQRLRLGDILVTLDNSRLPMTFSPDYELRVLSWLR